MKGGGVIYLGEREQPTVEEWQTDENGRRFRKVGKGAIEYEMMVSIDGHEVPASMVDEYHERKKNAPPPRNITETPTIRKNCPFKAEKTGVKGSCSYTCAFYRDGCIFTKFDKVGTAPQKDTLGTSCPMERTCNEKCAMYNHGCTLINLINIVIERR